MPFSQTTLFLSFLKIGSILYGSGYVLLAFLRSEFVVRLGWLTNQQAGVTVNLGQTAIKDIFTIMLLLGTLLASFRLKVNPIWLIIVGGVLGAFYKLAAG